LQDPSQINVDNGKNARCLASRHCMYRRRKYLQDKINELATNSKNKNIRGLYKQLYEFKVDAHLEIT
jgi:hypothetical protein